MDVIGVTGLVCVVASQEQPHWTSNGVDGDGIGTVESASISFLQAKINK